MKTPVLTAVAVLSATTFIATPAAAQQLVSMGDNGWLHAWDPVNGCQYPLIGQIPGLQEINAMAKHPSTGKIYVAGSWALGVNATLYEIDPLNWLGTPAALPLSIPSGAISVRGLAFDPTGVLYATGYDGILPECQLWRIDLVTGQGTVIGSPSVTSVQALAWDAANNRLVGWDVGYSNFPPGPGLIHIDPTTGIGTDPNPSAVSPDVWYVQGLGFGPDGRLHSVGNPKLREFDPVTGVEVWTSSCSHTRYPRGVEYIGPTVFSLALVGNCPTSMSAAMNEGTPYGPVAMAWSFGNTGSTVTAGPCAGTLAQLSGPATLLGVFTLDSFGSYIFGPTPLPPVACGNIWVQAIDLTTCAVTQARQP